MASAVAKRGLGNFVTDLRLIDSLSGNLEVDNGFSALGIARLVLDFHGIDPNSAPQYTLPVVEDGQEYFYQGGDYGDVVFPVQPQDQEVVSQFLGTTTNEDASGHALPSPGSFTIAVENGSGAYNQGATTRAALEQLGYQVSSVTDTSDGAPVTEATILYGSSSGLADALRLQSALNGLAVIGYDPGLFKNAGSGRSTATNTTIDVGSVLPSSQSADVVLVTGSNFSVNAPAGGTSSTTESGSSSTTLAPPSHSGVGSTTTTSPGPLANNSNLSAPSGATEALQPWDPRSCTATGGEGP
jgi:hypothetical protein